MAKRFTIGLLSELAKKVGGSSHKWTGTRTNISFLGNKGPDNPLFQGPLHGLEGATLGNIGNRNEIVRAVNDAMGYVTAGKLNTIQTEILGRNLAGIDKVLNPPVLPSASVTSIAPGIEGLKRFPKETHKFMGRPLKDKDFIEIERLAKEGKLGYQNPELYKGAQPGSTMAKAIDESVDIYPGLKYFDGPELAEKTHSARATMIRLLDVSAGGQEGVGVTLREIMSQNSPQDLKWLLEGGGGTKGDPIALFAKYFGNAATRNLPSGGTPGVIDAFAKRLMQAKDTMGRRIDDPFFSPEDIPFAGGGLAEILQVPRTDFRFGGFGGKFSKAQVLIARLKNTIKGMPDDKYVQETLPGFIKEIEANPKLANNEKVWKALGGDLPKDQRLVVHGDDTVDFFTQTKFGPHNIENITRFIEKYPFLSREEAMRILKMEPEDRILEITRLETLRNRTKNASGGLAKILEV